MDKLLEKMKTFCKRHELLPRGAHVVVGLSGGADSVCLLALLKKMQKEQDLTLAALHVHHGIRGEEADRDLAFSGKFAESLGIPFYKEYADVPSLAKEQGISQEEAGRIVRYEKLENLRRELGADRIAVAHHQDDNAETVFHHFLRGTGLRGLGGIRPKNGCIIRPLLACSRKELEEWLEKEGISYRTDSTNLAADVTRNKIRLELFPYIEKELQPAVKEILSQSGEYAAEIEDYLAGQALAVKEKTTVRQAEGLLIREDLKKEHPALQKKVIYSCLEEMAGSAKDLGQVHVKTCLELLDRQCGKKIVLPYDLEGIRTYEGMILVKKGNHPKEEEYRLEMEEISREEYLQIQENDYTKCFDYDKIKCCLELRYRQPGDRICVYQDGRSKKLQDFFVDRKVPARLRERIPLLADGDQILWALDLRVSEAYKVTEETKRIVKITVNRQDKWVEKQEEEIS